MRFSVLVPVYNGERYLEDCLSSLERQSFTDFETIIIDDGSTDGSGRIADEYAAGHENARVLHGPNQGLLLARRKGLAEAKGDYIVFADSDDMLVPQALSVVSEAVDRNGADIIVYDYSRDKDMTPAMVKSSHLPAGVYRGEGYEKVKNYAIRGYMNAMWMRAVRRAVYDTDADYSAYAGLMHGEDLFQTLPLVDRAASAEILDAVLYYYRPNDASSTARFKSSQLEDVVRVNRRLLEYGRKWGRDTFESALVGEAIQYANLLTITALSDATRDEKLDACRQIRARMMQEGAFKRASAAHLRPDHRLELSLLKTNHPAAALRISQAVQGTKRLSGMR